MAQCARLAGAAGGGRGGGDGGGDGPDRGGILACPRDSPPGPACGLGGLPARAGPRPGVGAGPSARACPRLGANGKGFNA